ncbi:hypothetical protein [Arthrobacter psychrolactophilus]
MTELRILPHRIRTVARPSGHVDKSSGARPKHNVWDGRTVQTTARNASKAWSGRYANKLRLSDFLITVVVVSLAYLTRFGTLGSYSPSGLEKSGYLWICLAIVVLWNLDLAYGRSREKTVFGAGVLEYRRIVQATLRTFGIMAIVLLVFHVDVSRGFFAVALPLGVVLIVGERWLWRRWLARQRSVGASLSNVVVLGNPQDVEYVIAQLRDDLSAGYKVAGAALTTLNSDMELLPPWYQVPVLSTAADISVVVAKTGAEAVIIAGALPGGPKAIQELGWRLEESATELILASSLTNVAGPRVHFRPIEGLPLMRVELPQYSGGKHIFKRVMDIVLAAFALLILSPVFLVLAIIVKADSPGQACSFRNASAEMAKSSRCSSSVPWWSMRKRNWRRCKKTTRVPVSFSRWSTILG